MKVESVVSDFVALEVDYAVLQDRIAHVKDEYLWANFAVALEMQPTEALNCLAAAAHEVY